jgi:hypothetical protein
MAMQFRIWAMVFGSWSPKMARGFHARYNAFKASPNFRAELIKCQMPKVQLQK